MNKEQQFRDITKLVMLFEAMQYQLDKVSDNPKVYRQALKNSLVRANKELDRTLSDLLVALYDTDEGLHVRIREGIDFYTDQMCSATLEWLDIENQKAIKK